MRFELFPWVYIVCYIKLLRNEDFFFFFHGGMKKKKKKKKLHLFSVFLIAISACAVSRKPREARAH